MFKKENKTVEKNNDVITEVSKLLTDKELFEQEKANLKNSIIQKYKNNIDLQLTKEYEDYGLKAFVLEYQLKQHNLRRMASLLSGENSSNFNEDQGHGSLKDALS